MTKKEPILYLMMGYPGAGKTTTAEIISQLTGAVHLSSDKVRLELTPQPKFTPEEHDQLYRELNKRTEQLLRDGHDVVYDANLNRYEHRAEKYEICKRTKAMPVLLWVRADKEVAKERAVAEHRAHLVPKDETADQMFDRIADIIEEPQAGEHPIMIDGTKVTKDYISSLLFNK